MLMQNKSCRETLISFGFNSCIVLAVWILIGGHSNIVPEIFAGHRDELYGSTVLSILTTVTFPPRVSIPSVYITCIIITYMIASVGP